MLSVAEAVEAGAVVLRLLVARSSRARLSPLRGSKAKRPASLASRRLARVRTLAAMARRNSSCSGFSVRLANIPRLGDKQQQRSKPKRIPGIAAEPDRPRSAGFPLPTVGARSLRVVTALAPVSRSLKVAGPVAAGSYSRARVLLKFYPTYPHPQGFGRFAPRL